MGGALRTVADILNTTKSWAGLLTTPWLGPSFADILFLVFAVCTPETYPYCKVRVGTQVCVRELR